MLSINSFIFAPDEWGLWKCNEWLEKGYFTAKRVFYYNPSKNANFRLLQRHNMTKTRNKIPAKISDFTVFLTPSAPTFFSWMSTVGRNYANCTLFWGPKKNRKSIDFTLKCSVHIYQTFLYPSQVRQFYHQSLKCSHKGHAYLTPPPGPLF
jgi:hypothetical protein